MPMTDATRLLTLPQLLEKYPEIERYGCPMCDGLGQFVIAGYDIEAPYEICDHCDGYGDLYLIKKIEKND